MTEFQEMLNQSSPRIGTGHYYIEQKTCFGCTCLGNDFGCLGPQIVKDRTVDGDILLEAGGTSDTIMNHLFGVCCWQHTIREGGFFLGLTGFGNVNHMNSYTDSPNWIGISNYFPILQMTRYSLYITLMVVLMAFVFFISFVNVGIAILISSILGGVFFIMYLVRNAPTCFGPGWPQAWFWICCCFGDGNRFYYHFTPQHRLYSVITSEGNEDIGIVTKEKYHSKKIMCCDPKCSCLICPGCFTSSKSTTNVTSSSDTGSRVLGDITAVRINSGCCTTGLTEYSGLVRAREPLTKEELIKWLLLYNISHHSMPLRLKYPNTCTGEEAIRVSLNNWSAPEFAEKLSDATIGRQVQMFDSFLEKRNRKVQPGYGNSDMKSMKPFPDSSHHFISMQPIESDLYSPLEYNKTNLLRSDVSTMGSSSPAERGPQNFKRHYRVHSRERKSKKEKKERRGKLRSEKEKKAKKEKKEKRHHRENSIWKSR